MFVCLRVSVYIYNDVFVTLLPFYLTQKLYNEINYKYFSIRYFTFSTSVVLCFFILLLPLLSLGRYLVSSCIFAFQYLNILLLKSMRLSVI